MKLDELIMELDSMIDTTVITKKAELLTEARNRLAAIHSYHFRRGSSMDLQTRQFVDALLDGEWSRLERIGGPSAQNELRMIRQ